VRVWLSWTVGISAGAVGVAISACLVGPTEEAQADLGKVGAQRQDKLRIATADVRRAGSSNTAHSPSNPVQPGFLPQTPSRHDRTS